MAGVYGRLDVTPKRVLGRGGYKVCCTVAERRDLVVLIQEDSAFNLDECFGLIEEEQRMLARLAALGLPVAMIRRIGTVTWQGKTCAAHLMKRYACGNREKGAAKFLRVLNERTLNQARRLLSQFEQVQPLYVDDLQFLFSRDGSFVIADPLYIDRRYSTDHTWDLRRIIKASRYSLAVRRGAIEHRRGTPIWQSAELWEEQMAKQGK